MGQPQLIEDDEGGSVFGDELEAGHQLMHGQYTIEAFLNAGGFGITYRAKDSLDRMVVIKECFPGSFCRRTTTSVHARSRAHQRELASIVRLFVEEARSLARLDHPNIVGVHQVFEENNTAYMALDFVEGRDLLDIIENPEDSLEPDQIEKILRKLLDAVSFIHEQGVLHRDISPDNILLQPNMEPILIDFGAAREEAGKQSRILSAMRVVKDGYSPQEFYISGAIQGQFSDLYALGATFYHLITGDLPANSQSRLAAVAAGEGDPYVPVRNRMPDYSDEFLVGIDKALEILPKDRIETAEIWLGLLDGKVSAEQLATESDAGKAGAKASAGGGSKKSKALLLGGAAILIPVIGGVILTQTGGSDAPVPDVVAPSVNEAVTSPSTTAAPPTTIAAPSTAAPATEDVTAPETDAVTAPETDVNDLFRAPVGVTPPSAEPPAVTPPEAVAEPTQEAPSPLAPQSDTSVSSTDTDGVVATPEETAVQNATLAAVADVPDSKFVPVELPYEVAVLQETPIEVSPRPLARDPLEGESLVAVTGEEAPVADLAPDADETVIEAEEGAETAEVPAATPVETEVAAVEEEVAPEETEVAAVEEEVAPEETEVAAVEEEIAPEETEVAAVEEEVILEETEVAAVEEEVAPTAEIEDTPVDEEPTEVEETGPSWLNAEPDTTAESTETPAPTPPIVTEQYSIPQVISGWTVDLSSEVQSETDVLFAVNELAVDGIGQLDAIMHRNFAAPEGGTMELDVLIGASEDAAVSEEITVPVVHKTLFLNGTLFETRMIDGVWNTIVASTRSEQTLQAGDILVGDLSTGSLFDQRTSFPDFLVQSHQGNRTFLAIAVRRGENIVTIDVPAPY